MKRYKLGFETWGFALFALIMIPNLISFAVPAAKDVLGRESLKEESEKASPGSLFRFFFHTL